MPEIVRFSKPAPPHNPLYAPAVCMCLDCCRIVLDSRCPALQHDPEGKGDPIQCGDVKGHKGLHAGLISTTFLIAEERLRLDGRNTDSEKGTD